MPLTALHCHVLCVVAPTSWTVSLEAGGEASLGGVASSVTDPDYAGARATGSEQEQDMILEWSG